MADAIKHIDSDFRSVIKFLDSKGDWPSNVKHAWQGHFRTIHRLSFSLIWWKFRIQSPHLHKKIYLSEMGSDALQILPMVSTGFFKSACLLSRGIIENSLRHIYYSDHPVEFQRLNLEKEWYLPVRELFEYLSTHPRLSKLRKSYDAYADLKASYSDLSTVVHGTKLSQMQMHSGLMQIKPNEAHTKILCKELKRLTQAANFLLTAYHIDTFRRFTLEDRSIVLSTLTTPAKNAISRI